MGPYCSGVTCPPTDAMTPVSGNRDVTAATAVTVSPTTAYANGIGTVTTMSVSVAMVTVSAVAACWVSLDASTITVPLDSAVTSPVADTIATVGALLFHSTARPVSSVPA